MTAVTIERFIRLEETQHVPDAARMLFERKYKNAIPDFPHHIVAYYRASDGAEVPACYIHFTDCGDILLGGGACVDDRVLRKMSSDERDALRTVGGIYQFALTWSVRHFSDRFAAVFGYCGDALAERVDRAAGFESTVYDRLLVYWTREVDAERRHRMVEKAQAFTPF